MRTRVGVLLKRVAVERGASCPSPLQSALSSQHLQQQQWQRIGALRTMRSAASATDTSCSGAPPSLALFTRSANGWCAGAVAGVAGAAATLAAFVGYAAAAEDVAAPGLPGVPAPAAGSPEAMGASSTVIASPAPKERPKPWYTRADLASHNTADKRIWVSYKEGVYDITDFILSHPGGVQKIMLAAGKAIDPFWRVYQQHQNSVLPKQILSGLRIGSLDPTEPELVRTTQWHCNAFQCYQVDPRWRSQDLLPVERAASIS